MLSRKDIMNLAYGGTYQKGFQIYRTRTKVMDFKVKEKANSDFVSALVRGSSRNVYEVEITYNLDKNKGISSYCTCPAFHTYSGVCKHCVAVLLQYSDYQLRNLYRYKNTVTPEKTLQNPERKSGRAMKPPAPETTADLKSLLKKEIEKRIAPAIQPDLQGTIKLKPLLEMTENKEISISFKIGGEKLYVLKDVLAFQSLMVNRESFSYGKKLEFVHTIEAFEEDSKDYVRFVLDWVRDYKARAFGQSEYSGYYYSSSAMRNISLRLIDFEKLMDVVGDKELDCCIFREAQTRRTISKEMPPLELIIKGIKNGAQIETDAPLILRGSRYLFFFTADKIHMAERKELQGLENFLMCCEYNGGKLFAATEDLPAFCAQILPQLRPHMNISCENFDLARYEAAEAVFKIYLDAPSREIVTCEVKCFYGDKTFNLASRDEGISYRDFIKETEVLRTVRRFFDGVFVDGTFIEMDLLDDKNAAKKLFAAEGDEAVYEALTKGLEDLSQLGEVFVSDALKKINVHPAPKVSVGVSLSGGLLDLSLLAGDMSKAELADILSRYNKKKKYYRLKNGDFIDIDNDEIGVLAELKENLKLTASELLKEHIYLPKYHAVYLDQALKEKSALPVERDRDFRMLIRNMRTTEDNDYELPKGLNAELREYQKRGFLWIKTLSEFGFGGILADDMGLGKTLQVITYLLSEFEEKGKEQPPHLIVCPASLVYNWQSELQRFAPQLSVRVIAGTASERQKEIAAVKDGDVCITSYELLRRDVQQYEPLSFGCQIIDEAQYIKNHGTQASKAVKLIRSSFRLALTGTPVENRLSELWSIFEYLMPGFLFSYESFRKEVELPIVQAKEQQVMERLKKKITPFVLRRLKGDVLHDLPDKIEKNMFTVLSGEQQKIYDADVKRLQLMLSKQSDMEFRTSKIQILAALTRLRQICCDPALIFDDYKGEAAKMEMCLALIENAIEGGHKILLFSQFTSLLSQIEKRLIKAGVSYYILTGATKKEERARLVHAFNEDDTGVFLISLKAGGTGLNLTAADVVIHFDPWWNLAVQDQATDRTHRIGQKNVVSVYKLIAKDTIEEKILQLQEQKRQLADQLLAGGDMANPTFDRDELLDLLK